jgi:hypothetical protein
MTKLEQDPSFWEGMSATYGYQYRPIMGAMYGASFQEDENFNVLEHLNDDDLADQNQLSMLAMATSMSHLDYLRTHTDKMKQNREILSKTGWGAMITAGILDPMNLFSLPFKGVGIGARFLSGAKSGFVIGAGQELIRAPFDPDSTITETGINVVGSTALVGTLGGITGAFGGRAVKKFSNEQTQVNKSLDQKVPAGQEFDFKNSWFLNSPFFKAVTTPYKRIIQGNLPQSTKKLMTQIGADGGLTSMMNKAGQGISSVFQRSVTYMGDYVAHNRRLNNIYGQYIADRGKSLNPAQKIGMQESGYNEFAERLTKERILREADPKRQKLSRLEEDFINEMEIFYTKYGVDMIDNGLLTTNKSLKKDIARLQDTIKDLRSQFGKEKDVRTKAHIRKMIDKQGAKLKDREALQKLNYDPQYKGTYFPRYFKIDAISERIDEFKSILHKWYTENPFYTKDMQQAEKLKILNETRKVKKLEKETLIDDIKIKKHGKQFKRDNPSQFKNTGGANSKSAYTDKQLNALKKLSDELPKLQKLIDETEVKITELEIKAKTRVNEAVENTIAKILNQSNLDDDFVGFGLSKHLRHRELDIPNHLILDFIETNASEVAMYYMMRTGSKIEFANTFKGKSIDDLIDEEQLSMIRHGVDDAGIASATADLIHMYDRVVGTPIHRPDAINRRVSRALTDWTSYVMLGRAGLSSLPELGMIIMQHGSKQGPLAWKNLGSTLTEMMNLKNLSLGVNEVQLAGEALDMVLGVAQNRMYEDFLRTPFQKGVSKLNEQGKRVFYTANLLAPITQITKQITGVLGQHTLVDRCLKLVAGTLDQEGIELLARYGLNMKDAKKIKKLFDDGKIQKSDGGQLFLANSEAWGNDALVRKFRGALATMTRNTIINATPADKPTIIDGVVYAKMNPALRALGYKADKRVSFGDQEMVRIESGVMAFPFQFWNYTLGATTKVLGAGFDNERTGKTAGMISMIALGYATLYFKNPYSFSNMDYEDQLTRAIDQTGITGVYSDLFYTSLHAYHRLNDLDRDETLIQPKYRVNPPSQLGAGLETATDFAGATPSYLFDVADTLTLFANGETPEAINKVTRLTPLSSLYGMRTFLGGVEDFASGRYY